MDALFNGVFSTSVVTSITVTDFLLCICTALVLGLILIPVYMIKSDYSKSFLLTLGLVPAVVCVVIMMVNGNIGAGVAVAGAFSLVRFRSAPGTAKEIVGIFIAMGIGLICGMGYLGYAALFCIVMCAVLVLYSLLPISSSTGSVKTLKITVPEDLNYAGAFDDIFSEYTTACKLIRVKSTNMGSMFRLTYDVTLKNKAQEKEFLDQIRTRNGNLEISISIKENSNVEL